MPDRGNPLEYHLKPCSGAGTAYSSGRPEFILVFCGVCVAQSFQLQTLIIHL